MRSFRPSCHTLLFSGHLQLTHDYLNKSGILVAIPFYFRVTCNKIPLSFNASSSVAIPFYFRVTCNPWGLSDFWREVALPYPSIFGSLATKWTNVTNKSSSVAIPFYFRVTCNLCLAYSDESDARCHTLLFSGHLQQFLYDHPITISCCHTLLFSGHLQPFTGCIVGVIS